MNALIGRHGHGGGGHGHRGGGGRRFFGGGGGWGGWGGWPFWYPYAYAYPYPYPYMYPYVYAYPPLLYPSSPYSWPQSAVFLHGEVEGEEDDGAAGEEDEAVGTAVAALSPGADGLTCQMDLGPDMWLRVSILVDGRRHETSVDLSGLLCEIAQRSIQAHASHGPSPASAEAAMRDMTAQTSHAVESAGVALVGALYEKHVGEISAGFWDSLKSVYRTVSTPVTWFHKQVAKTIQKVPGLKQAVTVAATAVATAYGGPAAGAAASRLAGPIIDSSAETGGDPTMLFEKTKQDAHRASGGDPKVTQAIAHAEKAITQTAAAYTLHAMSADARAGDPEAARRIAEIQRAAQAGDSASMRAMQILAGISQGPRPGAGNPTMSSGAFFPFLLGAAAGALGGVLWDDRRWASALSEGARRGDSVYRDGRLLYVPSPTAVVPGLPRAAPWHA